MARVLVTRAADDAERLAARLVALGHRPLVSPLLRPEAVAWSPPGQSPDAQPDALLITSARTIALAGPALASFVDLPVYCFGERTTAAASAVFADVRRQKADSVAALLAVLGAGRAGQRPLRLLHLTGERTIDVAPVPGIELRRLVTYRVALVDLGRDALDALRSGELDQVLLFSPATASHFSRQCALHGLARSAIATASISESTRAAAGGGWATAVAASAPTTHDLLVAAGLMCDAGAMDGGGRKVH